MEVVKNKKPSGREAVYAALKKSRPDLSDKEISAAIDASGKFNTFKLQDTSRTPAQETEKVVTTGFSPERREKIINALVAARPDLKRSEIEHAVNIGSVGDYLKEHYIQGPLQAAGYLNRLGVAARYRPESLAELAKKYSTKADVLGEGLPLSSEYLSDPNYKPVGTQSKVFKKLYDVAGGKPGRSEIEALVAAGKTPEEALKIVGTDPSIYNQLAQFLVSTGSDITADPAILFGGLNKVLGTMGKLSKAAKLEKLSKLLGYLPEATSYKAMTDVVPATGKLAGAKTLFKTLAANKGAAAKNTSLYALESILNPVKPVGDVLMQGPLRAAYNRQFSKINEAAAGENVRGAMKGASVVKPSTVAWEAGQLTRSPESFQKTANELIEKQNKLRAEIAKSGRPIDPEKMFQDMWDELIAKESSAYEGMTLPEQKVVKDLIKKRFSTKEMLEKAKAQARNLGKIQEFEAAAKSKATETSKLAKNPASMDVEDMLNLGSTPPQAPSLEAIPDVSPLSPSQVMEKQGWEKKRLNKSQVYDRQSVTPKMQERAQFYKIADQVRDEALMGSVSPELAAKYKAAAQRSRSAIKGKQVQIRGPEPETDLATTGVRAGMAVMAPKLAVATAIAKNQPIRNAAAALVTGGIMGAKKARGKGPLFDILARNYTTQGKKQWDVTKDKSWSQDAEEYLKEEPTAYNKTAPGNMVLIQQDTDPVTKAKADKIMELSGAPETERKYVESALFDAVPDSEIYKALKQKYKTVSFPEDDEPAE